MLKYCMTDGCWTCPSSWIWQQYMGQTTQSFCSSCFSRSVMQCCSYQDLTNNPACLGWVLSVMPQQCFFIIMNTVCSITDEFVVKFAVSQSILLFSHLYHAVDKGVKTMAWLEPAGQATMELHHCTRHCLCCRQSRSAYALVKHAISNECQSPHRVISFANRRVAVGHKSQCPVMG